MFVPFHGRTNAVAVFQWITSCYIKRDGHDMINCVIHFILDDHTRKIMFILSSKSCNNASSKVIPHVTNC